MKSLALFSLLCCVMTTAYGGLLSPAEVAGKRLYRDGVSGSGAEVSARIGMSGTVVSAASVPCAGCHGADGRGRPEGGVRPPDITWQRLSTSYGQQVRTGRNHPAYSDGAVSRAITEGIDPGGNTLDIAMPRFVMSSQDQANLLAYLKRIDEDGDPGVQPSTLRLGTLLPGQGPMAPLGDAVAAVLKGTLAMINEAGGIHGRQLELQIVDPGPNAESAEAAFDTLSGDAGVFALVSPLAPALDDRLVERVEQARVPLVGSVSLLSGDTDSPLIFEPLPGAGEQLRALGRYASGTLDLAAQKTSIVYPDDVQSEHQAQTLKQHLNAEGWSDVNLQAYPEHQITAAIGITDVKAVFFLGRAADFAVLAQGLEQAQQRPYLFAASSQVPGDVWQLPAVFSRRVFIAYPFVPGDWTPEGKAALARVRERGGVEGQYAVLQVDAYCSVLLVAEALRQIGRNPSREQLVKALEGLHDVQTGLTPMLGFGPGRRLGMSGAHVVRVDLQAQRFELVSPYARVNAGN